MKRYFALACGLSLLLALPARADDAAVCAAHHGSYLSGEVVKGPKFTHGRFRKGVELSHTHMKLRADQDGRVYDVAVDNIFVEGYRSSRPGVPPGLQGIQEHDRLELCGELYARGGPGIHFVHASCGKASNEGRPDGFIKKIGPDGHAGDNLGGATSFCSLF
ncbi:MAG: hypothetical protein ACXU8N_00960 [Telluria sp.]